MVSTDAGLREAAQQFASELEGLFSAVLGARAPSFDVEQAPYPGVDGTTRFVIRPPVVDQGRAVLNSAVIIVTWP